MTTRALARRNLTLVILVLLAQAAGGQTPAPPAPAEATVDAAQAAAGSPLVDCYRQAQGGGTDPYPCDLAVGMAESSGDPAALASALGNRALVLAREGRLEAALADVEAALAASPEEAALHGTRGNLLLRLGRPAEALAAHDRAVALAPEDPLAYYNRAFSHRALGAPERAEEDLAAARELAGAAPRERLTAPRTPVEDVGRGR